MEGCLLCLELNKDFAQNIGINSKEYFKLSIQQLIEKHLWSMNHVNETSWLCSSCWKELYEFHKFYKRVEEAHIDFGLLSRNIVEANEILAHKLETSAVKEDNEENPIEESINSPDYKLKDILNDYSLSENLENEQLIVEEQKPLIYDENKESASEDINLQKKRKRGRPRKNSTIDVMAPYNKTKKLKKIKSENLCNYANDSTTIISRTKKNKRNKISEEYRNNNDFFKESLSINRSTLEIKQEPYTLNLTEEPNNALDNHDDSDSNNDYSDHESLDRGENKLNVPKTNRNERDKFLTENFKITCFLCNIPLETFFAMRKHFEENHTERGHVKCCNKKFYRRSVLVDHVHRHLDPNYFKCNQCGKVMADRRCLELHVEIHEGNQEKNHCCDICGKGFAKLGVLRKHRMIHLSEEEKLFPCPECGKNFGSNYLLSSHHRSVHLKKYAKICDICGRSIRCKDVFERHMLQHEGKTIPTVSCDVCGLRLTDNKALKRHKDMIHPIGGKQEYTCSTCSKISPNLKAHKRHIQYKHVMGYDHKCTICDKGFKRAQTLREHMASHTGTILYTCPWCPKTFNSNANMHNHRKRVHPKEWEEKTRNRYSGNLPPNYKPPITTENTDFNIPINI